jgi:hypothetical protein
MGLDDSAKRIFFYIENKKNKIGTTYENYMDAISTQLEPAIAIK